MIFWALGIFVAAVILYVVGLYTYYFLKIVFGGPWGH